jgi:hypothetical protein
MSATERAKLELRRVVFASPRIGFLEYANPDPIDLHSLLEGKEILDVMALQRLTMVFVASHTLRHLDVTKEELAGPLKPAETPIKDMPKGDVLYHCGRCVCQAIDHDKARLMAAPTDLAERVLADAERALNVWKAKNVSTGCALQ